MFFETGLPAGWRTPVLEMLCACAETCCFPCPWEVLLLFFLFRNSSPCSYLWWGWYSVSLYDLGNVVRRYEIFVRVLHSSEVILLSYVNDTNL